MASIADAQRPTGTQRPDFFLTMAIVMSLTSVTGFSLNAIMGRSSFAAPLIVHAHAVVFFGWVVIYLLQNVFAVRGPIALHRRLGWIALAWIGLMITTGLAVTIFDVRTGRVPFFFRPQHFLIFDPAMLFGFTGLVAAAVALRKQTEWHRRLNYCAMTLLMGGPSIGRLLPMPLLIPWSYEVDFAFTLIFPAIGMVADLRSSGRVHPAWWAGLAAILAIFVLIAVITPSPIGDALYRAATAGSAGEHIPGLAFGVLLGQS